MFADGLQVIFGGQIHHRQVLVVEGAMLLGGIAVALVHVPEAGRPVNSMLPVGVAQSGGVIIPASGAEGIAGWGSITKSADVNEVHPKEFVTV